MTGSWLVMAWHGSKIKVVKDGLAIFDYSYPTVNCLHFSRVLFFRVLLAFQFPKSGVSLMNLVQVSGIWNLVDINTR